MNTNQTPPPFTVHRIADNQHQIIAGTFAHPAGWQALSDVQWNFQNYSYPVRWFARAFDPVAGSAIELFPTEPFCWIEPNFGMQQPGQPAGGGITLLPPMSSVDTLMQWVIPRYRDARTLRFVGAANVPVQQFALPTQAPSYPGRMSEGVVVRLEGNDNRGAFEEEFYGLKVWYPNGSPSHGRNGTLMQYNWGFERLFSFRAPKGQLGALRPMGWATVQSVRLNPQWEQLQQQILQQLAQQFNQHIQTGYAQIDEATHFSQQISQQNEQFWRHQQERRDQQSQSDQWRQQPTGTQGAYTQTDAFGDLMMGRESYHDPYYQYGSQHTGYHQYVWTDSQGNYQYSDDANFDPNVGSNTSWVPMQKRDING